MQVKLTFYVIHSNEHIYMETPVKEQNSSLICILFTENRIFIKAKGFISLTWLKVAPNKESQRQPAGVLSLLLNGVLRYVV